MVCFSESECDRNPKKGATQHASGTTLNEPALNLKKKHQKLYLFKRTGPSCSKGG